MSTAEASIHTIRDSHARKRLREAFPQYSIVEVELPGDWRGPQAGRVPTHRRGAVRVAFFGPGWDGRRSTVPGGFVPWAETMWVGGGARVYRYTSEDFAPEVAR